MGKDLETGANNKTEETTETNFLKRQQNNNTILTTLTSRYTKEVVKPWAERHWRVSAPSSQTPALPATLRCWRGARHKEGA